ncbi:hypothetical protein LTR97_006526 [Elasticomyces elasticus]|uniref:WKF domain-containing protein n=1 Tax=Elasticomyces elasticus TaxID=574655 RepID=A0AAN8A2L2_9PEZI|nr:hypothetical protein LTR97_006526 [Elasticomyces elasticus]
MSAATVKLVPAWKRLGLKLKYAKDTNDQPATTHQPLKAKDEGLSSNRIPKRPLEDDNPAALDVKPAKKRKSFTVEPEVAHENNPVLKPSASNHSQHINNDSRNATPIVASRHNNIDSRNDLSRRKSVTFTPDTKTEDSFSANKLFEEWSAAEAVQTAAIETSLPLDLSPPPPAVETPAKKAKARPQKRTAPEPTASRAEPPDTSEPPDYVRYLQQYHTDKSSWKFNKNQQKILLKNLFNVQQIPAEHDPALIAYLKGLGGAAAQQRVLEDAEGVLKALLEKQERSNEIEGMETPAGRKAAYEAALDREIAMLSQASGEGRSEYSDQQLQEIRRDVDRSKRADAILVEMLSKELAPAPVAPTPVSSHITFDELETQSTTTGSPSTGTPNENVQNKQRKGRKRKARTEVSSDESSSDSIHAALSHEPLDLKPHKTQAVNATRARQGPSSLLVKSILSDRNQSTAPSSAYGFGSRSVKPSGKKSIFDDKFLDEMFPKQKTYHETAPKRRKGQGEARGFAYTHGTRVDESASEDDD